MVDLKRHRYADIVAASEDPKCFYIASFFDKYRLEPDQLVYWESTEDQPDKIKNFEEIFLNVQDIERHPDSYFSYTSGYLNESRLLDIAKNVLPSFFRMNKIRFAFDNITKINKILFSKLSDNFNLSLDDINDNELSIFNDYEYYALKRFEKLIEELNNLYYEIIKNDSESESE